MDGVVALIWKSDWNKTRKKREEGQQPKDGSSFINTIYRGPARSKCWKKFDGIEWKKKNHKFG